MSRFDAGRMYLRTKLSVASLSVLVVVAACSSPELTVVDIRGRSFDNNEELQTWLGCDGQWYRTSDGMEDARLDWDADRVLETAGEHMGVGENPPVKSVVLAGNVWVLVDAEGMLFGSLEPGSALLWCERRPKTSTR